MVGAVGAEQSDRLIHVVEPAEDFVYCPAVDQEGYSRPAIEGLSTHTPSSFHCGQSNSRSDRVHSSAHATRILYMLGESMVRIPQYSGRPALAQAR